MMDGTFVAANSSTAQASHVPKLTLSRLKTRQAARWPFSNPLLHRNRCTCSLACRCGNSPPARDVSSQAPALQHPTPIPVVKPVVATSTTSARLSSTALRSNEPAGSVTQDSFMIEHRHVLADGAELELLEISPTDSVETARPPLLFIHGASHGAWCFAENFLPWFAQHGHHCFAVSLRGHGTSSDQSPCPDTYAQSNDDLAHVIASLPHPPVLIAHSMGGFFAQRYLVQMADKQDQPAVAGVVMMASASLSACIPNKEWWQAQQSSMRAVKVIWWMMTSSMFKNSAADKEMLFSSDLPDADFDRYHHKLRSGRQPLPAKFDELKNYLPKAEACAQAAKQLPVPVGVMIAGNDAVIMPFQVEATAAYFGVEAITLEGAAHDLQLDTRWEIAAQTLDRWLQDMPSPRKIT